MHRGNTLAGPRAGERAGKQGQGGRRRPRPPPHRGLKRRPPLSSTCCQATGAHPFGPPSNLATPDPCHSPAGQVQSGHGVEKAGGQAACRGQRRRGSRGTGRGQGQDESGDTGRGDTSPDGSAATEGEPSTRAPSHASNATALLHQPCPTLSTHRHPSPRPPLPRAASSSWLRTVSMSAPRFFRAWWQARGGGGGGGGRGLAGGGAADGWQARQRCHKERACAAAAHANVSPELARMPTIDGASTRHTHAPHCTSLVVPPTTITTIRPQTTLHLPQRTPPSSTLHPPPTNPAPLGTHLGVLPLQPQVVHGVGQGAAHEELGGQVVHMLGVLLPGLGEWANKRGEQTAGCVNGRVE